MTEGPDGVGPALADPFVHISQETTMNRSSVLAVSGAAAVGACLLALAAPSATATPVTPHKGAPAQVATGAASAGKNAALTPAAALPGYQQVTSALLNDPAGTQVSGSVACPAGNRVVGGGAVISSSSLSENLNASVPLTDGVTWKVYVNNSSSTAGTFRVYANCVSRAPGYKVVIGTGVTNPTGVQTSAVVSCPADRVPLGGGGFASSGSTAVNLNSSFPLSNGWRADVNNASTGSDTATAYVVCGTKPTGYVQVTGTAATISAGTQAHATASCPTGRTILGGGALSSSGSTSVNLNSTVPSGTSAWISYEDNSTTGSTSLTPYAICSRVR